MNAETEDKPKIEMEQRRAWMTYHFWSDLEVDIDWWDAVAVAVGFVGAFLIRAIKEGAKEP